MTNPTAELAAVFSPVGSCRRQPLPLVGRGALDEGVVEGCMSVGYGPAYFIF